jgi:hypothetical protein
MGWRRAAREALILFGQWSHRRRHQIVSMEMCGHVICGCRKIGPLLYCRLQQATNTFARRCGRIVASRLLEPAGRNFKVPILQANKMCSVHCATSQKVAGSIPEGVIGIFHWFNPSGRTMAVGSTQPLTEMSTRSISWGEG